MFKKKTPLVFFPPPPPPSALCSRVCGSWECPVGLPGAEGDSGTPRSSPCLPFSFVHAPNAVPGVYANSNMVILQAI